MEIDSLLERLAKRGAPKLPVTPSPTASPKKRRREELKVDDGFKREKCEEVTLLGKLLTCETASAAIKMFASKSFTKKQRKILASLAACEEAWVNCDQVTLPEIAFQYLISHASCDRPLKRMCKNWQRGKRKQQTHKHKHRPSRC